MSRWTGKSDFCDWCEMHNTPEEIVEKATIYIGNAKVDIKEPKDLIPYYTNLIASMGCSKDSQIINLSKSSYIDEEEEERLAWRIRDAICEARKAKRNKEELTAQMLIKNDPFSSDSKIIWHVIVDIINKNPEIIKYHLPKDFYELSDFFRSWIIPKYFFGIHLPYANRQREEFLKFAADNGFTIYNNNNKDLKDSFHPMLYHMRFDIDAYNKMVHDYTIKGVE